MSDWQSFESTYPLFGHSLRLAKQTNRLGHAHLVVSSDTAIRTEVPLLLAALAICLNPRPNAAPCGYCENCHRLKTGLYPDLFLLAPASASRQIPIGSEDEPDTLRFFESKFHLSASSPGARKIGIIHDCETMNVFAQNAFLKTLEEPPPDCLFILSTGKPAKLIPTIRSRCQTIVLTNNETRYHLNLFDGLPEILFRLTFAAHNNLAEGEKAAALLIDILNSLEEKAEATIREQWESRINSSSETLEPAAMKRLKDRMNAEISCEYRRLREELLSIIHAWFTQVLLLMENMPDSILPNAEIMKPLLNASPRPSVSPEEAARFLSEAEFLVKILSSSNVSDELAVRSFALSVAINVTTPPHR